MTENEFKAKYMDMAARVPGRHRRAEELYARARDLVAVEDVAGAGTAFQSPVDEGMEADHMGMTSIEKILASHSDQEEVKRR